MNVPDFIILLCTVISLVITYLVYRYSTSINETRITALEKFDFSKKINDQLLVDLYENTK